MATEYKFPYSASEINEKLKTVDETKNSLENDYYTSAEVDTKIDKASTALGASLKNKADLVDGKVPLEQLPNDGAISTLQSQVNSLEQQIAQKQNFNLVTSIDSNSTDAQYPSAKLLYDIKTNFDNILQFDTTPMKNSEKLVKSGAIATVLDEKADKTSISASVDALNIEIGKKANQSDVTATINSLNTEINKKADSENVYTKSEINGLITGVFYYKGSVETFADLPTIAKVGDTYNVKTDDIENNIKAGDNVVWCEIEGIGYWDVLSGVVDLSAYSTSEEIQDKLNTKADLVDGKILTSQLPDDIGGIETWDELKNKPLIDAEVIENSENLITSGGVYTAIQNASPNLIFDTEPTEGSSNLINSGSLYNVIGDISSVIDSINALIGGESE